jgi:hypothetical protein
MHSDTDSITSIPEVPKGANMSKKRNIMVGAASIAVAAGAIGTGALFSSSAMASSNGAAIGKATITVVQLGENGPVSCQFDDFDLPNAPFAVGTGEVVMSGAAVAIGDPVPVGSVSGAMAGSAEVVMSGEIEVGPDGLPDLSKLPQLSDLPGMSAIVSQDDARQGTPEECEAFRTEISALPAPTFGASSTTKS